MNYKDLIERLNNAAGGPAYAKCTVTYRGSACAALRGTYGLDNDPEIITNADRIRSMTDEELADWLNYYAHDGYINPHCGWYDWLRQPAEED